MSEPPEPVRRVRADAARRADQAWRARVAGGTWEEAAQVAGYANAANAVRAVRERYGVLPEPDRTELRSVWRARLEGLWRQAYLDAHDRVPGALTAGVRIASEAARLDGLHAPSEIVVTSPTTEQLESWVSRVLALDAPDIVEADVLAIESDEDPGA